MNVKEIVEKYLRDNGHDGLAVNECGCGLDDLMPCGNVSPDCVPAKRVKCNDDCPFASTGCTAVEYDGWCYRPVETTN